ncbi:carbon storage regulator [Neobacillus drentensis]|uniref:carbon storage regulator n=1 Tax=Neobacillus drentensis TaxID=220684 RepID=UPI00285F92AF|nr:carbon storage regulator [Neobacillus drentensis]MDR7235691.1 sRNA-binding carbon storage regulator CsrA [Neobacillus drentensis]
MLIVGREIGQSVIIGDIVKDTVLQIGPKLRLAIDAPKYFSISQVKQNGSNQDKLKRGTRNIGSATLIGEFIKVTILPTESGLLRFAIDTPKEITIFLEEMYIGKRLAKSQNVHSL